ncbi:MAG: hypothetical protein RR659_03770 [Bacilli bacterium]
MEETKQFENAEIKSKRAIYRKQRLQKKERYKKRKELHFRLTEDELNFIKKNAATCGISVTAYLLETSLYNKVVTVNTEELELLTNAITKFGTNLNQIAKTLNILKREDKVTEESLLIVEEDFKIANKLHDELVSLSDSFWLKLNKDVTKEKVFLFEDK